MDENFYKNINKVYCPYFKENISFTELGLNHIKYKNKYTARTSKDQRIRLMVLPIAVKILGLTTTVQGVTRRNRFENRFINNRKELALILVTYYEFVAVMDSRRVKIIIKQVEQGNKIFLSVIPLFKQKSPPEEGDGFN